MKKSLFVFVSAVMCLTASERLAQAQCLNYVLAPTDGREIGPFTNAGATNLIVPYFQPEPGRSYSVEVISDGAGLVSSATGDPGVGCPSTNSAGAVTTSGSWPRLDSRGTRVSVTPNSTGFVVTRVDSGTFRYSVTDTTLFNSSWSTVAGYMTQWGLQNTSPTLTVTGVLTVRESFGGSATYTRNVTLPPGQTTFITTLDTFTGGPIPTGRGGSATFTHTAPPGTIQGDGFLISTTSSNITPVLFKQRTAGR